MNRSSTLLLGTARCFAVAALLACTAGLACQEPERAGGTPTADAVAAAVDDALAEDGRRALLEAPPGDAWNVVEAARRRLLESMMPEPRRQAQRDRRGGESAFTVVWIVLLVVVVAFVAVALVRRSATGGPRRRQEPGAAADADHDEARRASSALREDARTLAREGRVRDAARTVLLALLRLVEEHDVLRVARTWTPREILARLVPRLDGVIRTEEVRAFRERLEHATYGRDVPDPSVVDHLDAFVGAVDAALVAAADGVRGRGTRETA